MFTRREVLRLLGGVCAIGALSPDDMLALGMRTHAGLDAVPRPGLLLDFAISHIVPSRLAHSEEPDMRGASIAVYNR